MGKGNKIGVCKLCGGEGDLCNSHVISEFLYAPAYDEKHRFISITSNPRQKIKPLQIGFREYLLCVQCEGKFNTYETHVAELLRNINAIPTDNTKFIEGNKYNYRLLKLFGLSLIWRCHVSSIDVFKQVDLGAYGLTIRRMLIDENPGSVNQFPFFLARLTEDILQRSIMVPSKIEGQNAYVFSAVGIEWIFFIRSISESPIFDIFVGARPMLLIPVWEGHIDKMTSFVRRMHASKNRSQTK